MTVTSHPPAVPVVDFGAITSGDGSAAARAEVARDLARKLRVNGYIGIRGHGVSAELLAEAFELTRRLFDLSVEDKMKAPHPKSWVPHRGYSGIGQEQASSKDALGEADEAKRDELAQVQDYKETYEVGSEHNPVQYNIWLPEPTLPGFRRFATDFYWRLKGLADVILDALIESLGLADDEAAAVRALHGGHDDQLRLAHYPPLPAGRKSPHASSRLGGHTDFSLFTLLFQNGGKGLEFRDRETSSFVSATPFPDIVYLNIGDMFERISNGVYPSAYHRVVIADDGGRSRYSIPFFVMSADDGVVEPQPSLVEAGGEQRYPPVTLRSYAEMVFSATNKH